MIRKANPLYIPIPRKIPQGLESRYDIVRRCNGSRKAMVNFICGIGGYSDRSERWAIEFNVKAHGTDLDESHLWKLLASGDIDLGPDTTLPAGEQAAVKALFSRVYAEHKDHLWDWGQEEAYEGWSDSDTPYETWLGERVEWKFGLRGRSGGHLVMTECEGINLCMDSDDFETMLMQKGDGITYDIQADDLRKLFIICVQNLLELTPKAAAEEIEYRAAWRLWASFMEDQVPAMLEAYRTRQQLGKDAGMIYDRLMGEPGLYDSFKTICTLADINIEE